MATATGFACLKRNMAVCLAGVAAAALWLAPARAADFDSVISLGSLNGTTGFRFDGAAETDQTGRDVASVGDINGDGFDDVIVGAYRVSGLKGASYVIFGSAAGPASAIASSSLVGSNGFRVDGFLAGDQSGYSVAGVGDVNGDGFGDFAVGATGVNYSNLTAAGCTYVVFGKASGFDPVINLSSLNGDNGFKMTGSEALAKSGSSVAGAGDVNGDGFDDFIIGAPFASPGNRTTAGSSFVVFGKASGFAPLIELSALNGTSGFRINGELAVDLSGDTVSTAGDVNGDGYADVIIGAAGADSNGSGSGASYVVFGMGSVFPPVIELSALASPTGFQLNGAAGGHSSGASVSEAGDVNGDGFSDLIIGADQATANGSRSGLSHVVFGKASAFASVIDLSALDGTTGFQISGAAEQDRSGNSVSAAGDINGDGFPDMVVGTQGADANGSDSGASYVVFGKSSGFAPVIEPSALNGLTGFQLHGASGDDSSGSSVSAAGDFNGDGFGDVIVGARSADPNGQSTGSAYVIYGRAPVASVIRAGAAADQRINGGPFTDFLWGVGGNDVLEGRGGGDILDGSTGINTASYAHAPGPTIASLALPSANTGAAQGDIYSNIQNLEGSAFADTLTGSGGVNVLTGNKGLDKLRGGKGKDVFRYLLASDSLPGAARDQIVDFEPGTAAKAVDKVDVSAIDANSVVDGNQAFAFRGTRPFTAAGQLRIIRTGANIVIQGNTGGTLAPEFEILLKGLTNTAVVTAKDFKL